MRFDQFLWGEPCRFWVSTELAPSEVADRLRPRVKSRFWPFHFEKVVGWVGQERLSIEWRGGPFTSNVAPQLRGRLVQEDGGTSFEGRFGAPHFLKFFLIAWLCFDALFGWIAFTAGVQGKNGVEQAPAWIVLFLLAHAAAPFGISAFGMIGADTIRRRLIAFVKSQRLL